MVIRLFLLGFCFSLLFLSVSRPEGRSVAYESEENVFPSYDASYKL